MTFVLKWGRPAPEAGNMLTAKKTVSRNEFEISCLTQEKFKSAFAHGPSRPLYHDRTGKPARCGAPAVNPHAKGVWGSKEYRGGAGTVRHPGCIEAPR